jgi:hypothetical protein
MKGHRIDCAPIKEADTPRANGGRNAEISEAPAIQPKTDALSLLHV